MISRRPSLLQAVAAVKCFVAFMPVWRLNSRLFAAPRDLNRVLVRSENGQSLIELAVTLPVLLLFLFCFIEVCLAFYSYNMISESAREGTQYAMYHSSTCTTANDGYKGTVGSCSQTQAQVAAYVQNLGWPNIAGGTMATPTVTYITATGSTTPGNVVGNSVQITVTYTMPIIVPLVPRGAWTMSSSSVMAIIQ
jgi:Flp pilus assembly protein TadG